MTGSLVHEIPGIHPSAGVEADQAAPQVGEEFQHLGPLRPLPQHVGHRLACGWTVRGYRLIAPSKLAGRIDD